MNSQTLDERVREADELIRRIVESTGVPTITQAQINERAREGQVVRYSHVCLRSYYHQANKMRGVRKQYIARAKYAYYNGYTGVIANDNLYCMGSEFTDDEERKAVAEYVTSEYPLWVKGGE